MKNIKHSFTKDEWKKKLDKTKGKCPGCNKVVGIKNLTIDHIYPINKSNKDYFKTGIKREYTINDIQPFCRDCNRKKGDK